jgi:hypothetical protein
VNIYTSRPIICTYDARNVISRLEPGAYRHCSSPTMFVSYVTFNSSPMRYSSQGIVNRKVRSSGLKSNAFRMSTYPLRFLCRRESQSRRELKTRRTPHRYRRDSPRSNSFGRCYDGQLCCCRASLHPSRLVSC